MSREDPQLRIRLPIELKEKIEESAKSNGRSMNAEIVQRLDSSFLSEIASDEFIPAKEALHIINKAKDELSRVILQRTFGEINKKIRIGHTTYYINLDDLDLEGLDDENFDMIFQLTFTRLKELGYIVPDKSWDASGFMVELPMKK